MVTGTSWIFWALRLAVTMTSSRSRVGGEVRGAVSREPATGEANTRTLRWLRCSKLNPVPCSSRASASSPGNPGGYTLGIAGCRPRWRDR